MPRPKLSDPASTPRFPYAGEARRETPIWTREQFGPWRCDVRVTPISGMRAGYPVFEVNCQWQHGPALDPSLGPTPRGGMAASDVFLVDRQARDMMLSASDAAQLAIGLGQRAADMLAGGTRPDLPEIARTLRRRFLNGA